MQAWHDMTCGRTRKADGGLQRAWHGGPATGNAILAGDGMSRDCHESGMQAPVALARGMASQRAAG